jgi:hypothetical protein
LERFHAHPAFQRERNRATQQEWIVLFCSFFGRFDQRMRVKRNKAGQPGPALQNT